MVKIKRTLSIAAILIVFAIVIVFAGRYFGFLGSALSPSDGYFLYGQSNVALTNQSCSSNGQSCTSAFYTWTGSQCSLTATGGCSPSWSVSGSDISLTESSSGSQYGSQGSSPIITTTQDFSQKNVRMTVAYTFTPVCTALPCMGSGTITIGSTSAGTLATVPLSGSSQISSSGGFEIVRQVFTNSTQVYWQGNLVKTYPTPSSEKLTMSVSAGQGTLSANFQNLRSIPIYSCQLGPTDLLGMESFSGGITSGITLQPSSCNNSTTIRCPRYPVKSFCLANPAILTDSTQGGATSTAQVYQILLSGNTVPLTQTQTLTMFYVIDNSQGLVPTQCSVANAYNVNNGTCTNLAGVVQICSQGIQDPTTGLCVVQPSINCSQGTYSTQLNQCIYTPSTAYNCSAGFVYNNATGSCTQNATAVTACTNGVLNLATNTCVYNPPVSTQCTQGTYNNATGQCVLTINTNCPSGFTYDTPTQTCRAPTVYQQSQTQVAASQVQSQVSSGTGTTSQISGSTGTTIAYTSVAWWYSTPMIALMALLIILAVLYLIFFTGRKGKTRWAKFKHWLKIQREGIFVGVLLATVILFLEYYVGYVIPILGTVLEWARQSYPIWVVVFVVEMLFVIGGSISDALYKPKQ